MRVGKQDAIGLGAAAAHTAAELVKLGKAETVGIFHHHRIGIGHIHAHLDYRGGNENVALACGEGGHDGLLFLCLHLTVQDADAQIGEGFLLQLPGIGRDRLALIGDGIVITHQRTDDKHLMALADLLADKGVDAAAIVLAHRKGIHLLTAGRQLIDDRHIQIAVDDQRQRAGNGCGGEHQHMRVFRLLRQQRALVDAEAVLLIGDDKPQTAVGYIVGEQGMGTDTQVDLAAAKSG